jgi:hypothetical protein
VVGWSDALAVDGSLPVDDGAEAEAARVAPTVRAGNKRAGALADVNPAAVPRVVGSDEGAGNVGFPVGDTAEDRDEVDRSSFDEAVDCNGRDRPGAAGADTLAVAS